MSCTDLIKIEIIDNNDTVVSQPYQATIAERAKMDENVGEWKRVGIVTETKSAYASPVLLVAKKDGDSRLVVDYRKLNDQTERNIFPTSCLDEHLEYLHNSKLFSTLDLASGYLQVPLTAFITPSET